MPEFFATHFAFLTTPEGWAAMVTLIAMEVVLGIDNLIFISILTNKLPPEHRVRARRLGISAALIMRLILLATISWIVGMTAPVFTAFGHAFSWRDLILIAGGLFLVWKASWVAFQTRNRPPAIRIRSRQEKPWPKAVKTGAVMPTIQAMVASRISRMISAARCRACGRARDARAAACWSGSR